MPRTATQSPQLAVLAKRLKDRLGNARLAQQALAAVKERAPDDQLALAFLTKLAENSATALKDVLRDRDGRQRSDLLPRLVGTDRDRAVAGRTGVGGNFSRCARPDYRRSRRRDAHRARHDRRARSPDRSRRARALHAPHDGPGCDRRFARPAERGRDGARDVGAGRRMHPHRARPGDPVSWRTRARGWTVLHPRDGQAGRARAQPQLGRRPGLSSRVLGRGWTAPKRRRAWANGSPKFCRRDAFESICGSGPAGVPRRW